ncbi:Acidic phosphoprotein precursor PCEMA1, putative [Plasmodium chabaudi adami]|uniref:Acidic phosphoprotein PCEMA1, putative n=1 Tax=Plasmodium chabaudi adami TaxID=5826 RepID=A0A1C6YLR8_PLACE|nr:Acidic phosphoprotein precursor PCEMA1, putative [Plasmodium chabaudi adami]
MNKFYIQIVFFLLSVSVYLNNKTLATEPAPGKATKTKSKKRYLTSQEIYEKNKDLLYTNPEETINAEKLMKEAVKHLEQRAADAYGYGSCINLPDYDMTLYQKKREGNTNIVKVEYKVHGSHKYKGLINILWDPDNANFFNNGSVKRKISRVYNQNLVMIQERFKNCCLERQKYFYALAKKVEISEDTTIIAMTSPNINDHHPSKKEYKNTIIESANLFTTEIDSEEDIRKGKVKKKVLNIGGYLIEKKDTHIDVTFIKSIS